MVKSACNAGDPGSIPGSGRSLAEGNASILAWEMPWTEESGSATVHGVAKRQTELSN